MGFREVLRELVTGEGVVAHQLFLARGEGSPVFSGIPNTRDVSLQVGENGDLARDSVSGIRALELCFDLLDGGQRSGVVARCWRGLGESYLAYQNRQSKLIQGCSRRGVILQCLVRCRFESLNHQIVAITANPTMENTNINRS